MHSKVVSKQSGLHTPSMKLSAELNLFFRDYVSVAPEAAGHLAFLMDNLGYSVLLDGSRESFVELERIYWDLREKGIPGELTDSEYFARLMGQYLGTTIIQRTGVKWLQCTDRNPTFGQPCLDGFGNKSWDRVFPVALASSLPGLKSQSANFPGARDRTVFACQLDKALKLSGER
jgi:hypothetical protein